MAYASIDELRADPDYQSLKSPEAKQQIENEFLQNLAEQKNKARPDYDINPREANIAQVTKWEDVEKDPDFQKLSDEGKARFIDEFRNAGGTYTPSVGKEISDTIQGGGSTIAYGGKKMMYGLGEMGTRLINNLPGGDTEAQAQAATKFFQDRERDNDTTYARQRYIYGQTEGGRAGLAHGEQVSDAGAALLAPIAPYLTAAYFAAKGAGQTYADTKSLPQAGMSATLGYAGARFAPEIPVFGKGGVIREGTEALSRFNPVAYSGLQKINRTAQVASDILNKVPGGKAVTTSLQNAGRSGVNNAIIGTATTTASQLGQGKSFPEAVQAGVESMPENFAFGVAAHAGIAGTKATARGVKNVVTKAPEYIAPGQSKMYKNTLNEQREQYTQAGTQSPEARTEAQRNTPELQTQNASEIMNHYDIPITPQAYKGDKVGQNMFDISAKDADTKKASSTDQKIITQRTRVFEANYNDSLTQMGQAFGRTINRINEAKSQNKSAQQDTELNDMLGNLKQAQKYSNEIKQDIKNNRIDEATQKAEAIKRIHDSLPEELKTHINDNWSAPEGTKAKGFDPQQIVKEFHDVRQRTINQVPDYMDRVKKQEESEGISGKDIMSAAKYIPKVGKVVKVASVIGKFAKVGKTLKSAAIQKRIRTATDTDKPALDLQRAQLETMNHPNALDADLTQAQAAKYINEGTRKTFTPGENASMAEKNNPLGYGVQARAAGTLTKQRQAQIENEEIRSKVVPGMPINEFRKLQRQDEALSLDKQYEKVQAQSQAKRVKAEAIHKQQMELLDKWRQNEGKNVPAQYVNDAIEELTRKTGGLIKSYTKVTDLATEKYLLDIGPKKPNGPVKESEPMGPNKPTGFSNKPEPTEKAKAKSEGFVVLEKPSETNFVKEIRNNQLTPDVKALLQAKYDKMKKDNNGKQLTPDQLIELYTIHHNAIADRALEQKYKPISEYVKDELQNKINLLNTRKKGMQNNSFERAMREQLKKGSLTENQIDDYVHEQINKAFESNDHKPFSDVMFNSHRNALEESARKYAESSYGPQKPAGEPTGEPETTPKGKPETTPKGKPSKPKQKFETTHNQRIQKDIWEDVRNGDVDSANEKIQFALDKYKLGDVHRHFYEELPKFIKAYTEGLHKYPNQPEMRVGMEDFRNLAINNSAGGELSNLMRHIGREANVYESGKTLTRAQIDRLGEMIEAGDIHPPKNASYAQLSKYLEADTAKREAKHAEDVKQAEAYFQ